MTEEKKNQYKAIQSVFLTGGVKKMRDIQELYPTKISKSLGINHSRYIEKLHKPEKFSIKHIWVLSKLLDLNIQIILDVIILELNNPPKSAKKKV